MNNFKLSKIIFLFAVTIIQPLKGQPNIGVSPDSLSSSLNTGEIETQTVTITNDGDSNLNWDIDIDWITVNSVTFTKADYADWTLPQNQDRVTDYIWITRADNNAIFNAQDKPIKFLFFLRDWLVLQCLLFPSPL